jgi:hypothetical protein
MPLVTILDPSYPLGELMRLCKRLGARLVPGGDWPKYVRVDEDGIFTPWEVSLLCRRWYTWIVPYS